MDNLIAHAKTLVEILLAVHALALIIVNVTPTKKDDSAVATYYRIVEIFAGIITRLAKQ